MEKLKLEDSIPDLPENREARQFLRKAPKTGLHMPLGKEVKVMQCWRCKAYGHRTGDRDCPLKDTGNVVLDAERQSREDPLTHIISSSKAPSSNPSGRSEYLRNLLMEAKKEAEQRPSRKSSKRRRRRKGNKSRSRSRSRSRK